MLRSRLQEQKYITKFYGNIRNELIGLLNGSNLRELSFKEIVGEDVFPGLLGRFMCQLVGDSLKDHNEVSERLADIHTETTINERRFLFAFFSRLWSGSGNVLEIGPFLGGTSRAIAMGMKRNPNLRSGCKLYTYDRFDNYYTADRLLASLEPMFANGILDNSIRDRLLQENRPSFLELFNLIHDSSDYAHLIEAARGTLPSEASGSMSEDNVIFEHDTDVIFSLPDDREYSAVFVDGAKSWFGTKYFMKTVMPFTQPGAYYIFQDYGAYTCFWIPMFLELFKDNFELISYVDHTYTFRLRHQITQAEITERFPNSPSDFSRNEIDRVFSGLSMRALQTSNVYTLMNYEMQHAAILAHRGEIVEAREKLVALLNTPFAMTHRRWIMQALQYPAYTPTGENVELFSTLSALLESVAEAPSYTN